MSAHADRLRFFADENILGVGMAMERVRRDLVYSGHPLIPECPTGAADTEWMPACAARGLVAPGRDKHIRSRPGELLHLKESGLRVFRLGMPRDLTQWGYLEQFVRHWDAMERFIERRGPGPWYLLGAD